MQTQTWGVAIAMTALCMTCALLSLSHIQLWNVLLSLQYVFDYYAARSTLAPLLVVPALIFVACRYSGKHDAIAKISTVRFGLLSGLLILMGMASPWFFHDFTRMFNYDEQCRLFTNELRMLISVVMSCTLFVTALYMNRKLVYSAIVKANQPFTLEESSLYFWTTLFYIATLGFQQLYIGVSSLGFHHGGFG